MSTFITKIYNPAVNFLNKGQLRTVKAKKNIFISIFIKGISIILGFILIPLTINYINPTSYGIWITLSSVIGWFSFFDIGLGNGLRNKLAESIAINNYILARKYVSTTYAILVFIIIMLLAIFLFVNNHIDWSQILNAPLIMSEELNLTALIVFVFFCIKFILSLLITVLKANQDPSKGSIFDFLGNLFAFVGIYILTKTIPGNLVNLSLTLSIAPVIVLLIGSIWLYKGTYKNLAPSFSFVDFTLIKDLGNLGLKFLILQISAIVVYSTHNMIISHLFGPEEVTPYNISYKLFFTLIMIFQIISLPFWSAFTEAYIKEDFKWIKSVIKKLKQTWFASIILAVIIVIFSPIIIEIWIGNTVYIPFQLTIFMAIYVLMHIWMNIFITFLNGSGKIQLQFYCSIITTILNIPLAIILGKLFGLPGIPLAGSIIFMIMGIIFYIQTNKILNKKAFGIWNK